MNKNDRLIGTEIEFPVIDTKTLTALSQEKFRYVWERLHKMGWDLCCDPISGLATGVSRNTTDQNGTFTQSITTDTGPILEIATKPETNMKDLYFQVEDLKDLVSALLAEVDGKMLSIGIHPTLRDTETEYYEYRTPRSAYDYAIKERGWPHEKLLNIAATQENIDVPKEDAMRAFCVLNRLCGLMIFNHRNAPDIYGNSNNLCIRPQKWLESVKSTIPKFQNDIRKVNLPEKEIETWEDYFNLLWNDSPMFLLGTKKHGLFYIPDHPTFLNFLKKETWNGVDLNGNNVSITPDIEHINCSDWTYFGFCRPRWQLNEAVSVKDVIMAIESGEIGKFFLENANKIFIENRCNATTMQHFELTSTAFVLGILENLDKAEKFVMQHDYVFWRKVFSLSQTEKLKEASIDGESILSLLCDILIISEEGLRNRNSGEETFLALSKSVAFNAESLSETLLNSFNSNKSRNEVIKLLLES